MKEKADSLQGKLQRADERITELTRVEIENEVGKPYARLSIIFEVGMDVQIVHVAEKSSYSVLEYSQYSTGEGGVFWISSDWDNQRIFLV